MESLWIPGPVPISDAVRAATCITPPSHLAPGFKHDFSLALSRMRRVWLAEADHQPFIVAGTGTLAMEAAAVNLVDPGDPVLVLDLGVFGDRMAQMLERRGAQVFRVGTAPGARVPLDEIERALAEHRPAVFYVTHVDTSTGAVAPARELARLAREYGVLSVFDGVCATAAEPMDQSAWGADVVLTASQKAIGLPAGLALWMASPAAMERRRSLTHSPPMVLDWLQWLPIMQAYEAEENAYFGTPPTTLIPALAVALGELLDEGMPAVFERHRATAERVRQAFASAGIRTVAATPASTLTAAYWPEGVGPEALAAIRDRGITVAGGLHPLLKTSTFRMGHMGAVTREPTVVDAAVERVIEGIEAVRRA